MARGKATGRYSPSRRGGKGGADQSQRWLGTYGDAVTLLMAFFVMLYAMSQIDQVKFEAFLSGLEAPFGNSAARDGLLDSNALIPDGSPDSAPPQMSIVPEPPGVGEVLASPPASPPPQDVDEPQPDPTRRPTTVELDQLRRVQAAITESLISAELNHLVDSHLDERGLVVSIAADDVLFETGSTVISPLGRRIIAAVAGPLGQFGNDVLVEGHTDDVPLRRGGYTNWNLSTDRAVAVLSLLYADFGLDQHRLGAIGYGEFRPRVPNSSPQNRSLNRRVDILVAVLGA